jgi:hypothetical protein
MGVMTNSKKYSEFANCQKYIGFVWDGVARTVKLPPGKREEKMAQIAEFLVPGATFTAHKAEVLAGRLNHISYLLPQLCCFLCSLYQWQMEWVNPSAKRPITDGVRDNLQRWKTTLQDFTVARIIPNPDPTNVGWVGDASLSYRIGVLIGKRWGRFLLITLPVNANKGNPIAWLETVAVRLGLLMLLKIGATPGKLFTVLTNNTTTYSTARLHKCRDSQVNQEWKRIQEILLQEQVDIKPIWIASGQNRANGLSRGKLEGHLPKDSGW